MRSCIFRSWAMWRLCLFCWEGGSCLGTESLGCKSWESLWQCLGWCCTENILGDSSSHNVASHLSLMLILIWCKYSAAQLEDPKIPIHSKLAWFQECWSAQLGTRSEDVWSKTYGLRDIMRFRPSFAGRQHFRPAREMHLRWARSPWRARTQESREWGLHQHLKDGVGRDLPAMSEAWACQRLSLKESQHGE